MKNKDPFQRKQIDEAAKEIQEDGLSRQAIYPSIAACVEHTTLEHVFIILEDIAKDMDMSSDFKNIVSEYLKNA